MRGVIAALFIFHAAKKQFKVYRTNLLIFLVDDQIIL
jgi:hypothetical protein